MRTIIDSRSIWKRDSPCPVRTWWLCSHRAIMKSKLQIMTGHNSRSLFRALCPIVALHTLVRPVVCLFARARPWALMPIWILVSICVHAEPTDAICRGPLRAATPRDSRRKNEESSTPGALFGACFTDSSLPSVKTWTSSFRSSPCYFIANLSGLNTFRMGFFDHLFFFY